MAAVYGDVKPNYVFSEKDFNESATLEKAAYPFSKVEAEKKAWELINNAKKDGRKIEMITINPGFVLGPTLSSRDDSTSIGFLRNLLNGTTKEINLSSKFAIIDVRDVVQAHITAMESVDASGRYCCCHPERMGGFEISKILKQHYSKYPITDKVIGEEAVKNDCW